MALSRTIFNIFDLENTATLKSGSQVTETGTIQ